MAEGQLQVADDLAGESRMGVTREHHHSTFVHALFPHYRNIQLCCLGKMAGPPGFEPGNAGIKIRCLTTWLRPKKSEMLQQTTSGCRAR
ncbi:hypothetical protein BN874_540030 [Candidatus Contendobacter odensis Run_B_J11]|uniref:Uncharacterized protein n=1 Tax=Candidatus Contendobacter odensis Run_B_J11 TaxID=1400861 RepID=A0A7U7GE90_9GAMM|nr:hypothetical protein BN874_540030 [Candidatus Contendobacter odensis Run_B_J11]